MARQGVVAMDFLGVGKAAETVSGSLHPNDRANTSSTTLVRPTPSLPSFRDPTQWSPNPSVGGAGGGGGGGGSSAMKCPQPKGKGWALPESSREEGATAGGAGGVGLAPQKPPSSSERSSLDKPLEELTEADIMQLTREDCRRYLKERGMRRPSWNKFQAIQQVLSLKSLFDSKTPTEKEVQKEDSPSSKDDAEGVSHPTLSLLRQEANGSHEHDMTGTTKEVHSFFGPAKDGFGMTSDRKTGISVDAQSHPTQFMNEKGSVFPSNSTNLLPNSELTLSLPSTWEKGRFPSNNGGFGSPFPVFLASKERPGSIATSARNVQGRSPLLQGMQPASDVGARPGSANGRPPAAQLTIFYAGLVNVYDEVPAEKARAIMLLTGSGTHWGTSSTVRPLASWEHPSLAPPIITTSPTIHANSSAGDLGKDGTSPPVSSVFNQVVINQGVQRRPHAELPQARKASLQRFLEKRKERVLLKAPYVLKKPDTEDSSAYSDRAFDISSSMSKCFEPGSTSPLPPPPHSLSAGPSSWPSKSCGSENSSPPRAAIAEETALNSMKGCARSEVEKQSDISETVNSIDEKMTETEEDAASSQV